MCNRPSNESPGSLSGGERGFTMIELIMFIIILSIGLVGILSVFNMTVVKSADPMIRKNMLSIAEALLEEVELMPFTYCDPSTTADPAQTWTTATSVSACAVQQGAGPGNAEVRISTSNPFNNVGDYGGTPPGSGTSGAAMGLGDATHAITDISGGYAAPLGYTATVALTAETLGPASLPIASDATSAANMNVFRITVTVSYGGNSVALEGYRARYWPNDLPW